jgi:hemolysin III
MISVKRWIKEPFPALSHWVGAVLSVAGLVLLLIRAAPRPWHIAAFAVYGTSLVLLYTASAMAHTAYCSPRIAGRLDRLDYAAIFLLIAGTYTPICLLTLHGPWGYGILAAEWLLAVVGIVGVLVWQRCPTSFRVTLYLAMGWLAAIAIVPLFTALPTAALVWLLAGGMAYSVGAIIFVTDRPRLWPGRFVAHDLWHVLVLVGSGCHFVVIAAFVAAGA